MHGLGSWSQFYCLLHADSSTWANDSAHARPKDSRPCDSADKRAGAALHAAVARVCMPGKQQALSGCSVVHTSLQEAVRAALLSSHTTGSCCPVVVFRTDGHHWETSLKTPAQSNAQ